MAEIGIVVAGAVGRMGRMLIDCVRATPGARLAGALEAPGHPALGRDAGELCGLGAIGVAVTDQAAAALDAADVVIDFTSPAATIAGLDLAAARGKAYVIGTTGLDAAQGAAIRAAATRVPVVWAPNFSVGVTLLNSLVERVAATLGEEVDIEILEMHHHAKVDAPSGTALGLGRAAAKGRGRPLDDLAVKARDGHTGARRPGSIGFATLRGGDVVGDHQVIFAAEGERLELGHRASSRAIFARGAVRAALWTAGRAPGLYDMTDVLGLKG